MARHADTRRDSHDTDRQTQAAREEKIERIVAMIDSLPDRGSADALIAPFRGRLADLNVRRPLNFPRLLFRPLDVLIVPGASWRYDRIGLPRTALVPLAVQCRAILGDAVKAVERLMDGCRTNDADVVAEAGAILWPLAAAALETAAPNAEWCSATGLPLADHADAVRLVITVLREASEIEMLVARALEGRQPDMAQLRPMLWRAAHAGDPRALGGLLSVLLARLPVPDRVFTVVGEITGGRTDPVAAATAEQALEFMLDSVEPEIIVVLDTSDACQELRRAIALLDGVQRPGAMHRASRRARCTAIRQGLVTACQAHFAASLRATVLGPLAASGGRCDDATQAGVEASARNLRQFEEASRTLGDEANERMLRQAAETLRQSDGPLVDRMRIVEILLGSDYAATMLAQLS